ncbi:PrgI family protein [Candidatus Peregrinibacteria bacterium]|nr:PrgI family protein [Candidatus Peregrinibacteria bacterium]
MAIEPVKIPQNVYVEDRIIGPITMRQLMLVMLSGGVSYAIWALMQSAGAVGLAYTIVAWFPVVIGGAFAFLKVNGISLFRIILLQMEKLEKPSTRLWTPHRGIYINITTTSNVQAHKNPDIAMKRKSHEQTRLEELSEVLDMGPAEKAAAEAAEDDIDPVEALIKKQEAEAAAAKPLPVNPERIRADAKQTPATVDGIAATEMRTAQPASPLFRDILPPPASHA